MLDFFHPDTTLSVPYAESIHPLTGQVYKREPYRLEYSSRLLHTPMNLGEIREFVYRMRDRGDVPEDVTFATAADELAIQLNEKRNGRDPRKAAAFRDIFDGEKYMQITDTVLRFPEGQSGLVPARYPRFFPRTVVRDREEIGEICIRPQSLTEVPDNKPMEVVWDEVFGLPKTTAYATKTPHHAHAYIIFQDVSEQVTKDQVIARSIDLLDKTKPRCLSIMAIDADQKEKYHAIRLVRRIPAGKKP